jgi:phosphoglycolate phosphatase
MGAPTVVFDLDGTLVDSAPDLIGTLNTVFAGEGLPPVPYDIARNLVGGGARSLIERSLAAEGRKLATAEVDRLVKEFIAHYASHIADRSRAFPSLESALDELGACGCRLAVCTNKLEWLSVRLLDALGLSKRFVAICGAVMVGDSPIDIATARAAAVPVIAVDYGYTESPVSELMPDRVIAGLGELPSAVFDLLDVGSSLAAEQR